MDIDRLRDSGEWRQVRSRNDWNVLDDLIRGGDDGIIKDLHWSNQVFVDSELRMVFDGEPYIGLLIQLQNKPFASVEIVVTDVKELMLDTTHDLSLEIIIEQESITLWLSGEGRSRIVGRELFYRLPDRPILGANQFDIQI